ncbi:uncharacterized protein CELE_C04G6.11 [Caenorhabditis elegans]|uniref:Uncharacterized protein n=1 Tax=Caenorhabditis elegans TaxID=6239 RepID=Q95QY0_CAEEL|nr:Uncharacterized protein CELE_C04G6.11 [Caenorhabditis elegans]CCD63058.1 Uncharacterized protein CELE_C04G6.11 [Caenorhabditis elegans]|eukprot:NP_494945.1 Uncharacterized protein CELE_C04G6.11 [Caenorhabditis elegans]
MKSELSVNLKCVLCATFQEFEKQLFSIRILIFKFLQKLSRKTESKNLRYSGKNNIYPQLAKEIDKISEKNRGRKREIGSDEESVRNERDCLKKSRRRLLSIKFFVFFFCLLPFFLSSSIFFLYLFYLTVGK